MSKRLDRERAESGLIFRDGKLVSKEEWYKSHPTREMQAQQQKKVDSAVVAEMTAKFQKPEVPAIPRRYYCTACRRYHSRDSKIGSEHTNFYLPTSKSQAKRLAIQKGGG